MSDVIQFLTGMDTVAKTTAADLQQLVAAVPAVEKAKGAVEGLTKTIQNLIATAGTGTQPAGALGKAFGGGKP